jgi:hypothetical protein
LQAKKRSHEWKQIIDNVINAYCTLPSQGLYDKTYFVRQNLVPMPLFPFVLDVAREYFWDNLLTYVDNYVATLVRICNAHDTTGDVRGRLFELAVIKKIFGSRYKTIFG